MLRKENYSGESVTIGKVKKKATEDEKKTPTKKKTRKKKHWKVQEKKSFPAKEIVARAAESDERI